MAAATAAGGERAGAEATRAGGASECPHFRRGCPGCASATSASDGEYVPPSFAAAREFVDARLPRGVRGFELDQSTPAVGSRRRARLAVRPGPGGEVAIGIFERGTHDVVDIVGGWSAADEPGCAVHHDAVNVAARLVRRACQECGVRAYAEGERSGAEGALRYIQLSVVEGRDVFEGGGEPAAATPTERVQLALVWDGPPAEHAKLDALARWLWERGGDDLFHSVWANYNDSRGNSIVAHGEDRWRQLYPAAVGSGAFEDYGWVAFSDRDDCDDGSRARVAFHPGSFMQSNHRSFQALLRELSTHVEPGMRLLDLYAGTGSISLYLAHIRAPLADVLAVESVRAAAAPFAAGVRALAPLAQEGMPRMEVRTLAEGVDAQTLTQCDVIVVDPPRRGLDEATLRCLTSTPPRSRVIYVSCGFKSFKRDCEALVGSGRYTLAFARGYPFFAGTDSFETLAVFEVLGANT